MIPDHDPVLAKRLQQADDVREALMRHSAFRGADVRRWYNQYDPDHELWVDVKFPKDDTRNTITVEIREGSPITDAIHSENARVAKHLAAGGMGPPPDAAPNTDGLTQKIRALEAQNLRLVAKLMTYGWKPETH